MSVTGARQGWMLLMADGSQSTPQNEASPGQTVVETAATQASTGGRTLAGPTIYGYWHVAEGKDPYLVIEVDTHEQGDIEAAAYKLYVNDQHVAGDGHG